MRQSALKVRANKEFQLVDNDAQPMRGRFLNHSTVPGQINKSNKSGAKCYKIVQNDVSYANSLVNTINEEDENV